MSNATINTILPDAFSAEQKNFLQGFVSGSDVARASRGLPTFAATLGVVVTPGVVTPGSDESADSKDNSVVEKAPAGPEAIHFEAQNRFLNEGKQLCAEEQAKRRKNPLDMWDEMQQHAQEERFPKGTDIFCFKTHGMFYVAPAQDSFMCRLRFHGGILDSYKLRKVADIAQELGGGYADITTRANLQIREIAVANAPRVLTALEDAGIVTRGAGADNIRNITGSPTAGIDPQELIDTRSLSAELHHHILHHRELYGLPRKFNIAFDGGGAISSVADTNDIGFVAVRVGEGKAVPAGVYFRVQLGGITGHGDFARDTGLLLTPQQCVPFATATVRVFIEHGDRTDRKKARLKYLLDQWGFDKFMDEVRRHLPFEPMHFPLEECEPRPATLKHGHVGFHAQRQPGLFYVGVVLPVGRLQDNQLRGLASIAERYGSGTIRLTVWQNLLISDITQENIPAVKAELEALSLDWSTSPVRGALVACTGNKGCRFSATDTKGHAAEIVQFLEPRVHLDQPINIHLTGCPHSCAQHYIGDVGLLGTKVEKDDDMVEGYHLFVGGGYGDDQQLGREVLRNIPADEAPVVLQKMLAVYNEARHDENETFNDFVRRHSTEQLQHFIGASAA
ncbi:MAG TPA: NirA family protein [Abditibacteriaceae bacterium]|jgi:ferredoxin-nitrite reductase